MKSRGVVNVTLEQEQTVVLVPDCCVVSKFSNKYCHKFKMNATLVKLGRLKGITNVLSLKRIEISSVCGIVIMTSLNINGPIYAFLRGKA